MDAYVQRGMTSRFSEALKDTPVLVLQGPRQCGKSTLVQKTCNLPYVTLDDSLALSSALKSPESWLKSFKEGAIIDEIQRAPQLMRSIKAVVDADRRPGRFVLTGSANVLLIPKLSDSLAGRMEVFTLYPFSQSELTGQSQPFIDRWLANELKAGENRDQSAGGYPEPLARSSVSRQKAWFQSYIRALMDRDVRDLAQIEGLHNLPNLLSMLAKAPYSVQNITQLSRDTGIPATSLTRYISLLQAVYLIHPIPAWTALHNGKASKTSRTAFVDTGIAGYLGGATEGLSALEQFAAMELVKESGWAENEYEVMHFRSTRQYTVPIVLGLADGTILGITIVDRETPDQTDFDGLRFLRDVAEGQMTRGIVLTQGQTSGFVDETLEYAPLSSLWAN
jgi:uncharacterized protein